MTKNISRLSLFRALKICYRHRGFPYTYRDFECVRPDHQHPNSAKREAETYIPNSAGALGYIIFGSFI